LEYVERFADANGEPEDGDCRRLIARAQAFLGAPTVGNGTPELRAPVDAAPDRFFHAEHVFRGTWSLCWEVAHDAQARVKLRELGVRPGRIRRYSPGEGVATQRRDYEVFGCLITSAGHKRLSSACVLVSRSHGV
jgi:hypothetical protein